MANSRFTYNLSRLGNEDGDFVFRIINSDGTMWAMPLTEVERGEMLIALATIPPVAKPGEGGRFGL